MNKVTVAVVISGRTLNDTSGAPKTAAKIAAQDFCTTSAGFSANWDTAVWSIAAGKLPILTVIDGQDALMPTHLLEAGAVPFDGNGDSTSPYQISSAAQLVRLAQLVKEGNKFSDKYFSLQQDIDLSSYSDAEGWTPIGSSSNAFNGSFSGNHNSITGLTINRDADEQGLFGAVDYDGTIENLGVLNANITARGDVGSVAGTVNGRIKHCYSIANISSAANSKTKRQRYQHHRRTDDRAFGACQDTHRQQTGI